jgi:integral membrane protein (TIGR01906 family)
MTLVFHEPTTVALLEVHHEDATTSLETSSGVFSYFNTFSYAAPPLSEFTAEELDHLLDVKILMHGLLLTLIIALLYLLYHYHTISVLDVQIASATVLGLFIILVLVPFDIAFTRFHQLFFAAGTWTFPASSLLIQTYPYAFFSNFFTRLAVATVGTALTIFGSSCAYTYLKKRRKL